MVSWTSRGLRVLAEPLPHPRVGVGVLGDVADDGDGIRAGGKNLEGTELGVSSLVDSWLLLRDIELSGERNRAIHAIAGEPVEKAR